MSHASPVTADSYCFLSLRFVERFTTTSVPSSHPAAMRLGEDRLCSKLATGWSSRLMMLFEGLE